MKVSLFYLPSIGSRAEIERGMAGLRGDLYERMLAELAEQARLADDLGYDSISFTEHHFHVEGFELSNNPVLLDLFVGLQTKRIRVGQLGIVLPAHNPIRVAEDIAMLDHMTGGRANAGFARGYQRRWVDVMAQQTHGIHGALPAPARRRSTRRTAPPSRSASASSSRRGPRTCSPYDGRYWRIPPGETPWTLEATRTLRRRRRRTASCAPSASCRSRCRSRIRRSSSPSRRRSAASAGAPRRASRRSCRRCIPTLEAQLVRLYAEVVRAAARRRHRRAARRRSSPPTDDEAHGALARQRRLLRRGVVRAVRLLAGLADPATGEAPGPVRARASRWSARVDTVTRQLERLRARLPVRWLFAWTYNGLIPHAELMRSIELFATQVLPRASDVAAARPA